MLRPRGVGLLIALLLACAPSAPRIPVEPVVPDRAASQAVTASAPQTVGQALTPAKLQVGVVAHSASQWVLYVAQAKAFARAENLELDIVLTGSAARVVQAVASGSLEIGLSAPDTTVAAAEKGADLVMFAGSIRKAVWDLIGRPGTRKVEELRGQTLGASSLTTGEVLFLKQILTKHGLESARDYDLLVTGGGPERFLALKNGVIAAAVFTEPQESMLMLDGYPRLALGADAFEEYQFHAFFASRQWLIQNEDAAVRFVKMLIHAGEWINDPQNKEEASQILSNVAQVETVFAQSAYETYVVQLQAIPPQAELSPAGVEAAISMMADPVTDIAKYIDLRYRDRALALVP